VNDPLLQAAQELEHKIKALRRAEASLGDYLRRLGPDPENAGNAANRAHLTMRRRKLRRARAAVSGAITRLRNLLSPGKKPPCPPCPVCKVPIKGWVSLARHLFARHDWKNDFNRPVCACGLETKGTLNKERFRRLAAHLAGQKDLDWHVTSNRLGGNHQTPVGGKTP
jgi:hypothetical protein